MIVMNEINNQLKYSKLLAGKLLGTLTEEQEKDLNHWQQLPDNKEAMDAIFSAHAFSEWKQKIEKVDTAEEWKSFLSLMETTSNNRGKVIKMNAKKWMYSVAAIFIIGITAFSLFKYFNPTSEYQSINTASIAPGSSHAELVLSDGEIVNLENETDKEINVGQVAAKNAQGVLQYNDNIKEDLVEVKTNTLRVPRGGEYQLVLSDGTKVWLNSDTELSYQVPFTGKERRVSLKGEAYFDVSPNKEVPFIVTTNNQEIEVLGTEFNISAYESDANLVTTLVEGKVKVSDSQSDIVEYLLPNEQSILDMNTDNIIKRNVDVYPYVAWKDGRFVFKNVSLEEFLFKIARWYDVEVFFENDNIKNIRFTGDLPRYSNMTDVLKIIESEMSVHIKVENNKKILISK